MKPIKPDVNALNDYQDLKALIIDENLLVHDTLRTVFNDFGINKIFCAQNAYYGLRLCEKHHFNIILCSFDFDTDKDGFHLLEEMKFKGYINKSTILIFLSAETSESLVNCIVELQPDDFWVKPLTFRQVTERLSHVMKIKKSLFALYHAMDTKAYSQAVNFAERGLLKSELEPYYLTILRLKGESLIKLVEYKDAEQFYLDILKEHKISWGYLGYAKVLLKQNKMDEIKDLLDELKNKPETRFATYDLLAQYYIDIEDYEQAYGHIKLATTLAPRNIERNKKSWDLARLNLDHEGQYIATQNMAKFAQNSIHDSPELLLNVVRSGIDYSSTLFGDSSAKVLAQAEGYLKKLEDNYDVKGLEEQILISQARVLNARNDQERAARIIENHVSLQISDSVEDNIDKVKVLHELGKREDAIHLLEAIKKQICGDTLGSQVVNKYIEQERQHRANIHFSPKQLNDMAVEHFNKKRMKPALNSLEKALQLTPKNIKVSISLLKVIVMLNRQDEMDDGHIALAKSTIEILDKAELSYKQVKSYIELKEEISVRLM
jgi:tetratricopeptide (TPR) repeat protein